MEVSIGRPGRVSYNTPAEGGGGRHLEGYGPGDDHAMSEEEDGKARYSQAIRLQRGTVSVLIAMVQR